MSAPDRCPFCGSTELHPRALPANMDRGAVEYLVCSSCGGEIEPVCRPESDAPSAIIVPLCIASKPRTSGPSVSIFAPLGSHLSARAAAASMSLDLMEPESRAEIFTADFAKELRGTAHV